MKKYNLHLKEDYKGKGVINYPDLCNGISPIGNNPLMYILTGNVGEFQLSGYKLARASEFSESELDKLPHGFVKLFDIIEVEEDLYYIKMPHTSGLVLNEDLRDGEVSFSSEYQILNYKTKFTLDYIDKTYPEYKHFAEPVSGKSTNLREWE